MNFLKITRLEPCRVVSFHVEDSLTPEDDVFAIFNAWAAATGLLEKHRLLPVLGFNHPWGPEGKPRGYEIWCALNGLGEVDLAGVTVKDYPGGLYGVDSGA